MKQRNVTFHGCSRCGGSPPHPRRVPGTPPWCRRSTPRSTLYIVRRFDNPRYYKYFVIKSCHVILGNSDVRPFHEIHVFSGLLAAISTECLDDECHIIGLRPLCHHSPPPLRHRHRRRRVLRRRRPPRQHHRGHARLHRHHPPLQPPDYPFQMLF
ncbi:Abscisic acid receptor PYL4 [Glycine soja]|uniref:Abscisic acid receptor PYL4 n=1 Tax=Glycine soja TaxID=3848 RepID=A0A0B2RPZ6_GLYSO|nr:Abscisic acid receptor PYL4 [Glycine soja]